MCNLIPDQANALNVQLDDRRSIADRHGRCLCGPRSTPNRLRINGVVTDNQIQHMPSFGRDVTKLTQLAPGMLAMVRKAVVATPTTLFPARRVHRRRLVEPTGIFATENLVQGYSNGNQAQNNGVSIDGISTTSAVWGGATVITPSEDSVSDVKIVTNSYDAEDGRFTGAQVQITSKSGSNDFHGSLFFTTHQPNLNAYQPYFGVGTRSLRDDNKFNQFGGSVGGPIWKNKIFAFFNYETVREPNAMSPGTGWYDTPRLMPWRPPEASPPSILSFPGKWCRQHGLMANATAGPLV